MLDLITRYYKARKLKWPNVWQAMGWVNTELAEVYELLLARDGDWVRNNPDDHGEWDKDKFAEELGDCMFMLAVAGMVEGVDPIEALIAKVERKLKELEDDR